MSRSIEPMDNLTFGEVAYVIELLAAMVTPEEIRKKVHSFTDPPKTVSGPTITRIAMKYSKLIAERNAIYLKNIEGNPLAHVRVRMDILQRIVDDSLTPTPSHSIRVGDDYEMVMKADRGSALKALALAKAEMDDINASKAEKAEADSNADDDEDDDYGADNGIRRLIPKA